MACFANEDSDWTYNNRESHTFELEPYVQLVYHQFVL